MVLTAKEQVPQGAATDLVVCDVGAEPVPEVVWRLAVPEDE